jgi:hypothetical protein
MKIKIRQLRLISLLSTSSSDQVNRYTKSCGFSKSQICSETKQDIVTFKYNWRIWDYLNG